MPDPTLSAALAEAYAIAPADALIAHTLEWRHRLFQNELGQPDSAWTTTNEEDLSARLEAGAPVRGGEVVRFRAIQFKCKLMPIETTARPQIQIEVSNITRLVARQLQRAAQDTSPVEVCYRPYLVDDLLSGPQMTDPPTFVLSEVEGDLLTLRATARITLDLERAFPSLLYTAEAFPGLIGA